MENYSKFQFQDFKIIRSFIERNENKPAKQISLNFQPKGIIDKAKSNFQLQLKVEIEDKNKAISIKIDAIANYQFENKEGLENLNDLFFVNAPALLFPYIRAYISTLTNLSGFDPINLPTLNMTCVGEDLQKNTSTLD